MIPPFRRYLTNLLPGPVDHDLVARYLLLKRPEDLAIIAAPMAPRAKLFDPDRLVETALALLTSANSVFSDHQRKLLEQMNSGTLLELNRKINGGFDHDLTAYDDPERLDDPVASPLVHHLRRIREDMPAKVSQQESKWVADVLGSIAHPTPALPCSLEKAIRYATGEKKSVPWKTLECAFIDRLGLMMIENAIQRDTPSGSRVTTRTHKTGQPQSEPTVQSGAPAAPGDAQALPKAPDTIPSRDDRLAALQVQLKAFKPLWRAPEYIAIRATEQYNSRKKHGISDEIQLASLVERFRDFWKTHKSTYVSRVAAQKAAKASGARGATGKREPKKYRELTELFCAVLNERSQFPKNLDEAKLEINGLINSHRMTKRISKGNALKFLSTLWNAVHTPNKQSEILGSIVRKKGFQTIQMDFALECAAEISKLK